MKLTRRHWRALDAVAQGAPFADVIAKKSIRARRAELFDLVAAGLVEDWGFVWDYLSRSRWRLTSEGHIAVGDAARMRAKALAWFCRPKPNALLASARAALAEVSP